MPDRDAWWERAACKGTDIDWFPSSEMSGRTATGRVNLARARQVCAACPVADRCLDDVLGQSAGAQGIWAGTTQSQRRGMSRTPLKALVALCGTDGGYYRHRRLGEDQCDACKAAHTVANSSRDRKRAQ